MLRPRTAALKVDRTFIFDNTLAIALVRDRRRVRATLIDRDLLHAPRERHTGDLHLTREHGPCPLRTLCGRPVQERGNGFLNHCALPLAG